MGPGAVAKLVVNSFSLRLVASDCRVRGGKPWEGNFDYRIV